MEIEFKAQRVDNKEWVYGYYYKEIGINNLKGKIDNSKTN